MTTSETRAQSAKITFCPRNTYTIPGTDDDAAIKFVARIQEMKFPLTLSRDTKQNQYCITDSTGSSIQAPETTYVGFRTLDLDDAMEHKNIRMYEDFKKQFTNKNLNVFDLRIWNKHFSMDSTLTANYQAFIDLIQSSYNTKAPRSEFNSIEEAVTAFRKVPQKPFAIET